jgi:hypothetical protein
MYHKAIRTLLGGILGLMLSVTAAYAQVTQIELPLDPGNQVAALNNLKTILTNMGGQIHIDAPQTGRVGAMFAGGHQVLANAWKDMQGKTGIILTCLGEGLAQAQERCKTVQRQYKP